MKLYVRAAVRNILDEDEEIQQEIAENPSTSKEVLAELAKSNYSIVLRRVLEHPNIDPNILDATVDSLIDSDHYSSQILHALGGAASNSSAMDSTLIKLAKCVMDHWYSDVQYVYIPLLKNPNTPAEALDILINEQTHNVHSITDKLISHPNVTLDILKKLLVVDNGYCDYIDAIAIIHHLPDDFLWEFAKNGCEADKRSIAYLEYTPTEILEYLIENSTDYDSEWIRADALKNPNLSTDAIYQFFNNRENLVGIIQNPNCPTDILEQAADKLIADKNDWSLQFVARNPNTSVDTMYKIFETGSDARDRLAQNPNIPTDLAKQLALSGTDWTKEQLARNHNVDPEVLALLVKSNIDTRMALARNPNTPPKTLMKLAKDRSGSVHYAVTENPNLPEEVFVYILNEHLCGWWPLEKHLDRFPQYKDRFDRW